MASYPTTVSFPLISSCPVPQKMSHRKTNVRGPSPDERSQPHDGDAQDITQEACLRALKFFDGFHGDDARAWLLAIIRNSAQIAAGTASADECGIADVISRSTKKPAPHLAKPADAARSPALLRAGGGDQLSDTNSTTITRHKRASAIAPR